MSPYPIYTIDEIRIAIGGVNNYTIINIEKGRIEEKVDVKEVENVYSFVVIDNYLVYTCKNGNIIFMIN